MNPEKFVHFEFHGISRRFDPILDIGDEFVNQSIFAFYVVYGSITLILPKHNTELENTMGLLLLIAELLGQSTESSFSKNVSCQ